jgi:hypothetical protein
MNTSSSVISLKEDFYSESFLTFDKALSAIKLSKIRDDNWKFLGYYGYYLNSTKNTFARNIIKKYRHETALEVPASDADQKTILLSDLSQHGVSQSAEDEIVLHDETSRIQKAIKKCNTKLWTSEQKQIFALRAGGESVKSICTLIGISSWKYKKLLDEMKVVLDQEIELAKV